MKVKPQDLIGPALNWAVSEAEGCSYADYYEDSIRNARKWCTDWAQGGPIIERENIDIEWVTAERCRASYDWLGEEFFEAFGPTPLIAAMRCYVASKLGDEVEVPDGLMET